MLNAAILLNGEKPVVMKLERIDELKVVLTAVTWTFMGSLRR